MSSGVDKLWAVTRDAPAVDADALADAVEAASQTDDSLDYRTRLLVRDSLRALESHWGPERFARWLAALPQSDHMKAALDSVASADDFGFPSLQRRIVDSTKPDA